MRSSGDAAAGTEPSIRSRRYTISLSVNVREVEDGKSRTTASRCSAAMATTRSACSIIGRFSRRAMCEEMSMPCSWSAITDSLAAGESSQPKTPADRIRKSTPPRSRSRWSRKP